jgi:hypothetical protein
MSAFSPSCHNTTLSYSSHNTDILLSDPLLAIVTFELALGQTTIEVELEMMVCPLCVTIKVEELNADKVQYCGDLVDLL